MNDADRTRSLLTKMTTRGISRRTVLQGAGALWLGLTLGGYSEVGASLRPRRQPGSLPYPNLPEGTDTLPEIEHVITLMMENHSYDSYLGVLDRGDGFPMRHERIKAANPDGNGNLIHAFHMPNACQLDGHP